MEVLVLFLSIFVIVLRLVLLFVLFLLQWAMDSGTLLSAGGLEVVHQNGVYPQLRVSGDDSGISDNVNGNAEDTFQTYLQNEMDGNGTTAEVREGSNDFVESNGLNDSKVVGLTFCLNAFSNHH